MGRRHAFGVKEKGTAGGQVLDTTLLLVVVELVAL